MKTLVLLHVAALVCVARSREEHSYDTRYLEGVNAYRQKGWKDAIDSLRQSMDEFSRLEEARQHCYAKCAQKRSKVTSEWVELQFFERVFQRRQCIRRCVEEAVGLVVEGGVPHSVFENMKNREGLNYLQVALNKLGQSREAAQSFAQYYYYNPQNQNIRSNFVYYRGMKEVEESDLKPTTTVKHRELFFAGDDQYYSEDWAGMVESMESALLHFYQSLQHCRHNCLGPIKYSSNLGFYQTLSKIHSEMMNCQVRCPWTLGDFRTVETKSNFFAEFFNYLQFGYYHLNQTEAALAAAAALVRLDPHSEDSRGVAKFYQKAGKPLDQQMLSEGVLVEVLKHEGVVNYRHLLGNQSGHVIHDSKTGEWSEESGEVDATLLELDYQRHSIATVMVSLHGNEEQPEPVVIQTAKDYDGLERLLVDQMLTQQQCENLIKLASFGREGDGYGSKTPHTVKEKFEGLHVLEAAKRSTYGEIDPTLTWLYVNASRRSKEMVSKVFNLEQPLYFSYTHLVCRTSNEGMQDNRSDLSHPVHSDNCILNELTGECNKVPPAYTWRDYSALLYLNGDFEGGEFFFAHSTHDLSPDVLVKPECGRLVGFSAGQENMHGVKGVTKGKRCAVALWFTLDPEHSESAFTQAEQLLETL